MTKFSRFRLWAAFGMLVAGSYILYQKHQQAANTMLPVDIRSLRFDNGWGYEIDVDHKTYIHQDCIPAITGFKRFQTEDQALKVGQLVIGKIKSRRPPSVSLPELDSLHITR